MNTTQNITITTRNRNLRYGWSNTPSRDGPYGIEEPTPDTPSVGLRGVEAARADAVRGNAGNAWSEALWVGGHRVVSLGGLTGSGIVGWLLSDLRERGYAHVTVEVSA